MKQKKKKIWRDACEYEITSMIKNKTWNLVERPTGTKFNRH